MSVAPLPSMTRRNHLALHLAHRWFAFLEAPGGDLATHLGIFDAQVQLTGSRRAHAFAHDHASLVEWFAAIPDEVSSHHILHSTWSEAGDGVGRLGMVVAYQAPAGEGMRGSIISYDTVVAFDAQGARFLSLDKTPILPNTRSTYDTSWATHRTLALVHGALGSGDAGGVLQATAPQGVIQVTALASASEGARAYEALVVIRCAGQGEYRQLLLSLRDDVRSSVPVLAD